jgi:hypothetical protein
VPAERADRHRTKKPARSGALAPAACETACVSGLSPCPTRIRSLQRMGKYFAKRRRCPREEHDARIRYVRDHEFQPGGAELFVHQQERKPQGAAAIVDAGCAMACIPELPEFGGCIAAHHTLYEGAHGAALILLKYTGG